MHAIGRKSQTSIQQHNFVVDFKHTGVLTNFVQSPERNDFRALLEFFEVIYNLWSVKVFKNFNERFGIAISIEDHQ
jgi:hypothetical protein